MAYTKAQVRLTRLYAEWMSVNRRVARLEAQLREARVQQAYLRSQMDGARSDAG